jgi:hypothetical protein
MKKEKVISSMLIVSLVWLGAFKYWHVACSIGAEYSETKRDGDGEQQAEAVGVERLYVRE